jgi:hypothetical protein
VFSDVDYLRYAVLFLEQCVLFISFLFASQEGGEGGKPVDLQI